jgi:hypothetical protein
MPEPRRDALLRSLEDFERAIAEFQWNNAALATPLLLRRLDDI